MRILAFTDTHGSKKALEKLVKLAKKEKIDVLLCAGDLTVFERGLGAMLKILAKTKILTFVIHGNHETETTMELAVRRYKNIKYIHRRIYRANHILVMGYGGGGFSLTDAGFEKTAKKFSKAIKKDTHFILVTHAPPYKTKLDKIGKSHSGNKSIARFIRKYKPLLAVSGHLHETEGRQDKMGKTVLINPGIDGMIVEV